MNNFIKAFENSIKRNYNNPAIEEYNTGICYSYGELAHEIESLRELWAKAGLKKDDKIALNAKNSINWVKTFWASVAGGYISTILFNAFTPSDTQNLVNHSESRLLYTEKKTFERMDFDSMPNLIGAIDVNTGELLAARGDFASIYNNLNPRKVTPQEVSFFERPLEETCTIMYTSGSTGNPKGVMLAVRNFSSNVDELHNIAPYKEGESILSTLPFAHIFGLTCDAIKPLCTGMHLYILGHPPVPTYLKEAFGKVKPRLFFGVPLVFIKFIDSILGEYLHSEDGKKKLDNYERHPDYCNMLKSILLEKMGGEIQMILTGGAATPADLEDILAFKIKAPFTTGYGLTETAPVLSFGIPGHHKAKSCGRYVNYITLKIDSDDQYNNPGEVLVKGDCVFNGYYKNPQATAAVFTEDGYFKTGDMGIIDHDRHLFLVGRCKNMILSDNGQNIYPEEIETILNDMPYIKESLIVHRNNALTALIVPDDDRISSMNLDANALRSIIKNNLVNLNKKMPSYSQINDFELRFEPFAKTPKGSIRRFMYK